MRRPVDVSARAFWTDAGFYVRAGHTYYYRAPGWWVDLAVIRDADGYDAPLWYAVGKPPREQDEGRYFRLWGAVFEAPPPAGDMATSPGPKDKNAVPTETFPMGRDGCFKPNVSGWLYAFTNDRQGYFWQNSGKVSLHVAEHELPVCEANDVVARWNRMVAKTHGLPVIGFLLFLLVVILAGLEQGQDIMSTLIGADWWMRPQVYVFWASAFFLGLQAWFWSRIIIIANYGAKRRDWNPKWFLVWLPRVFAFLPFLAAALAFYSVGEESRWEWAGVAAGLGVVLGVFLIMRQRMFGATAGERPGEEKEAREGPTIPKPPRSGAWKGNDQSRSAAMARYLLAAIGTVGGLLVAAAISIWPVAIPQTLGAPAVLFLAVGFIIPVVAGLANMIRVTRFPLVATLIMLAIVFSPFNDNHEVGRRGAWLGETKVELPAVSSKPSIETAVAGWAARQKPIDANGTPTYPIVFVAAEGGASRAGYWTALVLDRLQTQTEAANVAGGSFSDRLFAVSSVSGGSVGSAGFIAAIAGKGSPRVPETWPVVEFAGKDFLSPALAGVLYPDLIQRFWFHPVLPDGAEALERAWEEGWLAGCQDVSGGKPACPGNERAMEAPFLSFWPNLATADANSRWVPLLMVNGAREEDGKRILTSPVSITPEEFPNTLDFHGVTGKDVRLSTAILNGARFPYISPPGTLVSPQADGKTKKVGHIVDGGYFDTIGTETLTDLITAVMKTDAVRKLEAGGAIVQPVVIEINNTDVAAPSSLVRTGGYKDVPKAPDEDVNAQVSNEVFGPLFGLLGAQASHGTTSAKRLARQGVPGRGVKHVLIHLYPYKNKTLSLDWAFSPEALNRARQVAGRTTDINNEAFKANELDPCGVGKQIDVIAKAMSDANILNDAATWAGRKDQDLPKDCVREKK